MNKESATEINQFVESKFPPFLSLLFFVDMWERFSYYGMRALLVLFLINKLGFSDPEAYGLYSLFAALAYAGPIIGGVIADKILGFRKMVLLGGIILTAGHILMFFEEINDVFLYLGLGTIAVGTGFFKGNIANLLGECYLPKDPERDRGFTLLFVSVNLGATLAVLTCSYVAKIYGWNYGFGLAAVGMGAGLLTFLKSHKKIIGDKGGPPSKELITKPFFMGLRPFSAMLMLGMVASCLAAFMLKYNIIFTQLLAFTGIFVLIYTAKIVLALEEKSRKRMIALGVVMLFFMLFFSVEMQLGSLFNLFAERNVDKYIFGYALPASISQSINPFTILVMGPILSFYFVKKGGKWNIARVAYSLLLTTCSFAILYLGCEFADESGQISFVYLLLGIGAIALGELFIAPVLYNFGTLVPPAHLRGFTMGIIMFSLSLANLSGNIIAKFMSVPTGKNRMNDSLESLAIYQDGFMKIFFFYLTIFILYVLIMPKLNKYLKNIWD
jgi:POT family proton-dependent oligopeptide transporter